LARTGRDNGKEYGTEFPKRGGGRQGYYSVGGRGKGGWRKSRYTEWWGGAKRSGGEKDEPVGGWAGGQGGKTTPGSQANVSRETRIPQG